MPLSTIVVLLILLVVGKSLERELSVSAAVGVTNLINLVDLEPYFYLYMQSYWMPFRNVSLSFGSGL